MVQTLQEQQMQAFRDITGDTSGTWNENALSAFDALGITIGNSFNGDYIQYLQLITGSTSNDINDLLAAARAEGPTPVITWSEMSGLWEDIEGYWDEI